MGQSVDNLVLEQLRLIREDLKRMDVRFDELEANMRAEFDDVKSELHGHTMMIFGLSNVIGQIDKRVEHVEEKLGIK
ncbi:hypothetical protein G5B31_18480 [Rhodobacter sp. SGA-6-6]|uniref:hypothetical protein n=1 Tax=Rhodobacter sp. SGA-6-6 TaxID=2710882 RepID=UPI0013E9ED8F|nr:hypothetical protein [Rhodobacter sp. SGA-6-6]NGM47527.1 hypothetical protein [Rhodobacter sp. SGA-6-6]